MDSIGRCAALAAVVMLIGCATPDVPEPAAVEGLDDQVFEDAYDVPHLYGSERNGVGQALSDRAVSWLARSGRWVWSPLVDRYVPLPE